MKFLILLSDIHSNGGVENSSSLLTNSLIEKGHKVEIISFGSKSKESKFKYNENINIHYMNFKDYKSNNKLKNISNIFIKIYNTRKKIKEINPEYIYSYGSFPNLYNIICGINFKRLISERIHYHHMNYSGEKKSFKVKKFLIRFFYPFVKLITISKKDLNFYSFLKNKEVLYNPLQPKKDFNIEKENIILAVGRLTQQKGYDLILSRINELNLTGWRFIILGEGPELDNLKALSKGKVEFHGFQDPHEYYAKSKIFILPSRYEGFGNVLPESMQYGCVPIAFDCNSGPSEILTKENGILVENKNVDEFIKAINLLIENEELTNVMSKKSELIHNNFSTEKHVENFLRIIKELN